MSITMNMQSLCNIMLLRRDKVKKSENGNKFQNCHIIMSQKDSAFFNLSLRQ